jgi:hypothetical protein
VTRHSSAAGGLHPHPAKWPLAPCISLLRMTAQDAYRSMIRDHIAPALREMGFKGSGQNYALPSETHWVSLWFQKSAYSDARKIRFTLHLLVVGKDEWEAIRETNDRAPERPRGFWGARPPGAGPSATCHDRRNPQAGGCRCGGSWRRANRSSPSRIS